MLPPSSVKIGCGRCDQPLDFSFTFAFQPIVDVSRRSVWGYEALVRGCEQQSAAWVLGQVNRDNLYTFDQACRVTAIRLAAELNLQQVLSINFLPNAVYEPAHCIRSTLAAAEEVGFPAERIMFEITESEQVHDPEHLTKIFNHYRQQGFITALDDFGAGHAGLNLLARFTPGLMKIDRELITGVHQSYPRQVIVRALCEICDQLSIELLAEGVETQDEAAWLYQQGITLMQGYYFARPGFKTLPQVDFSGVLAFASA